MAVFSPNQALGKIDQNEKGKFSVTFGSGSPAGLLGGLGAYLGCWAAGLKQFRLYGGVSAGSALAGLASLGLNAVELVRIMRNLNFGEKVSLTNDLRRLRHRFSKDAYTDRTMDFDSEPHEWRCTGFRSTKGIGEVIDYHATAGGTRASVWPKSFWTMATTRNGSQVVFKADGVFLIKRDSSISRLSDTPVSLSAAVRLSSTIPGYMAALRYKNMFLFDGALSRDGLCPVGIPIRHFGVDPRKMIACHLGDDTLSPIGGGLHSLLRSLWGVESERHWGSETGGVIDVRMLIDHLHMFKFWLTQDEKWLAILIGFEACVSRLALAGILRGQNLRKVQSLFLALDCWRSMLPSPHGRPQLLAAHAEKCLSDHGFF